MPLRPKRNEHQATDTEAALDLLALQKEKLQGQQARASHARETLNAHREEKAAEIAQALEENTETEERWTPDFQGVTIPCFMVDMQMTRTGDIIFKLRVPFKYRNLAMPLSEAYSTPLEADIHKWTVAANARRRISSKYLTRKVATNDPSEPGSNGSSDEGSDGDNPNSADYDLR